MARKFHSLPLQIFLNGYLVGYLRRQPTGAVEFQYDPSWLTWEHSLPVSLSLPLRETPFRGERVTAVFDNLLPDDDAIRRLLAKHARAEGTDAFSLLSAVGRDCVGALQFLPEGEEPAPIDRVNGRLVSDKEIAAILKSLGRNPLGVGVDEEFRISIAGAQEKTALLYWKNRWRIPHGTTATTHILKPEIGILPNGVDLSDSVENEYFCMELTHALGLPTAKTTIKQFDDQEALVVKRFDRHLAKDERLLRLPQEDCCQALAVPPTRKYESDGGPGMKEVLDLLLASDKPEEDRNLFFKAQMVFWLLGATDGHAKNFSIHLLPAGCFHLTPFYDIMSAQPYVDAGQLRQNQMKIAMAVGDKRHYVMKNITARHFIQTARACGLPSALAGHIFDELKEALPGAIDQVMSSLPKGFPQKLAASIVGGIKHRMRLF